MLDGVEFGTEVVALVRGYLEREITPLKAENEDLKARIKALEDRPLPEIDLKPVERLIEAEIAKLPELPEIPQLPELPNFDELVGQLVNDAVAALPPAEPGKPGEDGKSIEPEAVREMVEASVANAVAALPAPRDGKDAANIVEALKDGGELVLTLQDGRLIRTGIRDGEKGKEAELPEPHPSLEQQSALVAHFLRRELGEPDELPPLQTEAEIKVFLPQRGAEETVVTERDEHGRVSKFEKREI